MAVVFTAVTVVVGGGRAVVAVVVATLDVVAAFVVLLDVLVVAGDEAGVVPRCVVKGVVLPLLLGELFLFVVSSSSLAVVEDISRAVTGLPGVLLAFSVAGKILLKPPRHSVTTKPQSSLVLQQKL